MAIAGQTGRGRGRMARAAGMLHAASARSGIAPFIAMDMLAEANRLQAQGRSILHLELGQPGTPAPRLVREAVRAALDSQPLGYTDALGIAALRERIAQHYQDAYGVHVPAGRVIVTTGSSAGFILAFLALFDVGEKVALPMPGYPAYRNILEALGLGVVPIATSEADRWTPGEASIRAAAGEDDVSGLLVASPANPSGTMLRAEALALVARCCAELGMRFISDEIYHRLTYDEPAATALSYSSDAIVINSFSKYYCMTGWRVGWMIVPEELVRPIERLAQNLYISVPALAQYGALAAFDATEELEANKAVYAANRALLLEALPGLGLGRTLPMDGAFYVYADVSGFTNDSADFAWRILRETGVALTPGADFDREQGHRFIRLSYAGSHSDVAQALERLGGWLRSGSG